MELLLAIVAGVLYATGLYLMLRRRLAQLIIGLSLVSNGSNILILSAAAFHWSASFFHTLNSEPVKVSSLPSLSLLVSVKLLNS